MGGLVGRGYLRARVGRVVCLRQRSRQTGLLRVGRAEGRARLDL